VTVGAVSHDEPVIAASTIKDRHRNSTKGGTPPKVAPLFPPIDQRGALPFPLQRLTPHSLSQRARDTPAGDLGAHRQ